MFDNYKKLLTDFWRADSVFSSQKEKINHTFSQIEEIGQQKQLESEHLKAKHQKTIEQLQLDRKNHLKRIASEEETIISSEINKRDEIELAKKSERERLKEKYQKIVEKLQLDRENHLKRLACEEEEIINTVIHKRDEIREIVEKAVGHLNDFQSGLGFKLHVPANAPTVIHEISLQELEYWLETAAESAKAIENEIKNFNVWKESHDRLVNTGKAAVVVLAVLIISIFSLYFYTNSTYNFFAQ